MKRFTTIAGASLLLLMFAAGTTAFGQDFDALVKVVDKIEVNLRSMVEKESESRRQDITKLRKEMSQLKNSGSPAAPPTAGITEEQLADVIAELAVLTVEVQGLKRIFDNNAKQLVSIDDEGFYLSPKTDPEVVELSERLAELSTSLESLLTNNSSAIQPNPSVKHGNIALSAFVHEHFNSGPDETSSFVSKRARLTIKGDINEYAQIKIQGEFAKSPKLLDGQVTISPHKQWSLSMGQYKPPFGTDFLISASSTPFVNRSIASGLGTNRDIGATVSYRNNFSPDYSLKFTAGLFNGSGINTSDANNHKNFVARLEAKLFGIFTLSPNVYAGKTNEVDALKQDLVDVAGSLTWKWHREIVEAEYIRSEWGNTERRGWYIWGGHSFDIGLGFLKELQLLARYEQYDPDASTNDDRTNRLTAGTNLFVDNKYTKIQLNYELNSEQGVSIDNNEFFVNVQVAF